MGVLGGYFLSNVLDSSFKSSKVQHRAFLIRGSKGFLFLHCFLLGGTYTLPDGCNDGEERGVPS